MMKSIFILLTTLFFIVSISLTQAQPNVGLIASAESTPQGSQVCVNISTENFTDINSIQFSIHFEYDIIDYSTTNNLNLPGNLGVGDFFANSGILTFSWIDPMLQGVSFPDGTTIFQTCFDVVGNPGDVSPFNFVGSPAAFEFVNGSGQPLNFSPTAGSVTVSGGTSGSDNGLIASSETAPQGSQTCVNISTENFTDVISMQFSIHFDYHVIDYTTTNNLNLPGNLGVGEFLANSGILTFSWLDPMLQGVSPPDGTAIFQICFDAVGNPGDVSPINFEGSPTPFEFVSGSGLPLNFSPTAGSVTVSGTPGPAAVPTMGEWAMILFSLICMAVGLAFVFNAQSRLALNEDIHVEPYFGLRQFPFEMGFFNIALKQAILMATAGFIGIYIIWGEIIFTDLIGMVLCVPVAAYILHLVKLFER